MFDRNGFQSKLLGMQMDLNEIMGKYNEFSGMLNKFLQEDFCEPMSGSINREFAERGMQIDKNMRDYLSTLEEFIAQSQDMIEDYDENIAKWQ